MFAILLFFRRFVNHYIDVQWFAYVKLWCDGVICKTAD